MTDPLPDGRGSVSGSNYAAPFPSRARQQVVLGFFRRLFSLRWLILTAVAALLAFQLFVPPIIGLSDQGDFGRMIGRFGYGPQDKSMPLSAGFVQAKYVRDPSIRIPVLEQAGPEYLFTGTAIALSKIFSKGVLDIRVVGLVHAVAFLFAFAWLLRVTGPITWIVPAIAFTDVGYVAYWNSFYTEPATCIAFILLPPKASPCPADKQFPRGG